MGMNVMNAIGRFSQIEQKISSEAAHLKEDAAPLIAINTRLMSEGVPFLATVLEDVIDNAVKSNKVSQAQADNFRKLEKDCADVQPLAKKLGDQVGIVVHDVVAIVQK